MPSFIKTALFGLAALLTMAMGAQASAPIAAEASKARASSSRQETLPLARYARTRTSINDAWEDDDEDERPRARARKTTRKAARHQQQRHARRHVQRPQASWYDEDDRPRRRAARGNRRGSDRSVYGYQGGEASGIASYYWQGQQTASGARFNPNGLTAAHRTLPFGTRVRVTNMHNGRSVDVTINDRGPFIAGRIIDLSRGAASVIGMTGQGLARVKMEVIGR